MQFDHSPDTAERPSNSFEFKAILLVDDDRQLASALQWILADESFLVDVAYDGEEALAKIRANKYDLVVCDVMMPRLQGDALYEQSKLIRPDFHDRFIFITGHAAEPRIKEFLAQSKCRYMMKPFPVGNLIEAVKEMLT